MVSVTEINLPDGLLKDKITICFLQIKSPFPDEISEWVDKGYKKFGFKPESYKKRENQIKGILNQVKLLDRKIDIIVFPEYSFDEAMVKSLKLEHFAKKNKTIVVGNYYDKNCRKNLTFIVVPNDAMYKAVKQSASRYDKEFLIEQNKLKNDEKKILRFNWYITLENGKKEKVYFQIFTCKDFLIYTKSKYPRIIDNTHGGIIIVPMCTPKIQNFRDRANSLMREVDIEKDKKVKSTITVLCNAVSISQQSLQICGNSQVIGPYRGKLPLIEEGTEGGIIIDIDPLNALIIPSLISEKENAVIDAPVLVDTDKFKEINWQASIEDSFIINPNLIKIMNLKKYYGLYRLKIYYPYRSPLKQCTIKSHGIYGYYDVLLQSFEEESDFLDLRINKIIPTTDVLERDYIEISEIIKYRGKIFMKINNDGSLYENKNYILEGACSLNEYRENIKNINKGIPTKVRDDLKDKKILIEVNGGLGNSDISEKEKKLGSMEFLVFVFVKDAPYGDIFKQFNVHILSKLIDIDAVRTVEFSESGGNGKIMGRTHYILHMVGKEDDVTKIIIEIIHKNAWINNIDCHRTINVLVAEVLSTGENSSFRETVLLEYETKKTIKEIMNNFPKTYDIFAIKRLNKELIEKVLELYLQSKTWLKHKNNSQKKILEEDRDRFVYSISIVLAKEKIDENDIDYLKVSCEGFFLKIIKDLELILHKMLVKKANEVGGSQVFVRLLKQTYKDLDFRLGKETTLGKVLKVFQQWNTRVCKNSNYKTIKTINGEEFKKDHEDFKKCEIENIRNWFSHPELEKPIKNKKDVIEKLLNPMNLIIKFVLRESKKSP